MDERGRALWDEWAALPAVPPVEDEIAGILDGLPFVRQDEDYLFRTNRLFTLRRLMRLWSESELMREKKESGVRLIYAKGQKSSPSFRIRADEADQLFERSVAFGRRTRNWNWVRGLWGSCGALYVPKTGYYLILRPPLREGTAARLQSVLRSANFTVGVRKRAQAKELMLRDQQQITTFLSRLGFVQSILQLEETAIYRQVRSHANKLVNCDSANINKSLEAAQGQLQLIRQIESEGLFEELPEVLKELIVIRKNNPSMSLKELGQSLPRPISKSTVEYRWRKLETVLHNLTRGDGSHVPWKGRR